MSWGRQDVVFGTTHLLPFHHFGGKSSDREFAPAWAILAETMGAIAHKPSIIVGDFNTDSLSTVLPGVLQSRQFGSLVHAATRPSGEQHDDILCSAHWRALRVQAIPSVTNHHICIADIAPNAVL
jgi:endonuclease/exonuclease/phosphatase family metal-dependent hydrolase